MRILIVEDNADLALSISEYLELQGHLCDFAYNGKAGLVSAQKEEYDIYVFDIAMPLMTGLELCQILRSELKDHTPVLFLTARDTLDDKLKGFSVGADDYLVKPFELKELNARLRAINNRHTNRDNLLTIEDLSVNLDTGIVTRSGTTITLGPNLYTLLVALLKRSPALVSRQELEYILWGETPPDSDSLRSHIYKLRNQIDKPFKYPLIKTVKGRGFKIS